MKSNDYQKLAAYEQEIARLQKSLQKFNQKLLKLPAKFGFKSVAELIAALKQAAGGKVAVATGGAAKAGKRQRAVITPEIKQQVKAMTTAGKTGAQVAAAVGISLPSVQNIKKELGLVKKRSK
jgi:hypothetical protein